MNGKLKGISRDPLHCRRPAQTDYSDSPGADDSVWVAVDHIKIDRALKFMATNYNRPLNLADMIKVSQLSRRGFFKAFIKHTGVSPGQFLREFRIERSKSLLIENDLILKQVALLSGFRSLNSFCVAFRRVVGVAPKEFQRQEWLKNYKTFLNSRKNGNVRSMTMPREALLGSRTQTLSPSDQLMH